MPASSERSLASRSAAETALDNVGVGEEEIGQTAQYLERTKDDDALPADMHLARHLRVYREREEVGDAPLQDAAWLLIARALAQVVMNKEPDARGVMECSKRFDNAHKWVRDAWKDACVAILLSREESARGRWIDALGRQPTLLGDSSTGQVAVRPSGPSWELPDAMQLWGERDSLEPDAPVWTVIDILYRVDKRAWLLALDKWDDPRMVQAALFGVGYYEPEDSFLLLLSISARTFSPEGTPGRVAPAIVLALAACDKAKILLKPPQDEQGEGRARHFLASASSTLMERPDGTALALALAAQLVSTTILRVGKWYEPAQELFADALFAELTRAGVSVSEQRRLLTARSLASRERGSGARSNLAAFVVAVRTLGTQDANDLLPWIEDLLKEPAALRFAVEQFVTCVVGALGRLQEGVAACRLVFERLEPQRWRAEHKESGDDWFLPSLIVLAVLARLINDGLSKHLVGDLAYARDRCIRIMRMQYRNPTPAVQAAQVLRLILDVGCAKLGLDTEAVSSLLMPLRSDRKVLALLLEALARRESAEALHSMLEKLGHDPYALCATADAWAAATETPDDSELAQRMRAALKVPREGETTPR